MKSYEPSASPITTYSLRADAIPASSALPYPRTGTATTRAPAAAARSRDPSVLPLSATITSPLMPYVARAPRACVTQSATVAASFRHGMTIDSSRRWSKPLAMLARDPQPGGPYAIDVGERADACADLVGHRIVERQDHQRLAARGKASDLHRRDVPVVLAEQRAGAADEAGLVLMLREEQVALDRHVDPEPVYEHDAWLALHERPRDLGVADAHGEERVVSRGLGLAPFLDHEAARMGDRQRVHEVHALGAERLEQALHHRGAQWLGVELEQLAGVRELQLRGALIEQLRHECADALAASQPRAATGFVGRWSRRVDGVAGRMAVEDVEDLLHDIDRDVHLGLGGRAGEVRRKHRARRLADGGVGRQRLARVDVEGGTGDGAGLERRRERRQIDDLAARAIHQDRG